MSTIYIFIVKYANIYIQKIMPLKELRIMSKFGKQSEALKDLKEIVHSYERGGGVQHSIIPLPPPFFLKSSRVFDAMCSPL